MVGEKEQLYTFKGFKSSIPGYMIIYQAIKSTKCSVSTVTDDAVPTMNSKTLEMQIKIKTSTLFSCDLTFHARFLDLPSIT